MVDFIDEGTTSIGMKRCDASCRTEALAQGTTGIGEVRTIVEANRVVPGAMRGHGVHGGGEYFARDSCTYTFRLAGV